MSPTPPDDRVRVARVTRADGTSVQVEAPANTSLLDVARHQLGLGAANRGCRDGTCGACRLLLDGALVNACLVPWDSVREGATIEAYEDLEHDPAAERAVDAFALERPTRCRQCTPALGVTAVALARHTGGAPPDANAIDDVLRDATCACTGRGSWRRALLAR